MSRKKFCVVPFLQSGEVTLAAGAATVTNKYIDANTRVLLCRKAATADGLSFGITPGLGNGSIAIDSSNAADVSTIQWIALTPGGNPASTPGSSRKYGNAPQFQIGAITLVAGAATISNVFIEANTRTFLTRLSAVATADNYFYDHVVGAGNGSVNVFSSNGADVSTLVFAIINPIGNPAQV